jgi:hypothetical protein
MALPEIAWGEKWGRLSEVWNLILGKSCRDTLSHLSAYVLESYCRVGLIDGALSD